MSPDGVRPPTRPGPARLPIGLLLAITIAGVAAGCGGPAPTSGPSAPAASGGPATQASPGLSGAPAGASGAPSAPAPSSPSSVPATGAPPASGAPATAPPAAGLDVCALVPPAVLSAILGGEVAFPKQVDSGGWAVGQCAWNGPASTFMARVGTAASIRAFADPAAPDAKALLAQFEQQAAATGSPRTVAGIGDGAVVGAGGMAAYQGGTFVQLTKLRLTEEQLVAVMEQIVAHLP